MSDVDGPGNGIDMLEVDVEVPLVDVVKTDEMAGPEGGLGLVEVISGDAGVDMLTSSATDGKADRLPEEDGRDMAKAVAGGPLFRKKR